VLGAIPAEGEEPGGRFVVPADPAVYGEGLARLLDLVAERMPKAEVESVWAFPGVRREAREYGIAVICRRAGEGRYVVYRARYVLQVKGQDRGRSQLSVEETAEAPADMLPAVIEGVRRRADEAGDAELLDLTSWRAGGAGPVAEGSSNPPTSVSSG
jgi:hypothetical protein